MLRLVCTIDKGRYIKGENMTDDELLYAMNECAASFEDSRKALGARLTGKKCRFGNYVFRVDEVNASVSREYRTGEGYAYVWLRGADL